MSRKNLRRIVFLLAVFSLAAAFIFNHVRMAANQAAMASTAPAQAVQVPTVAVLEVTAGTHQAHIEGVGSAETRFELTLSSRISGQVSAIDDHFETGRLISKGQVLATLEDSQWQAELAAARNTEASARVSYLEEQQEYQQAKQEWASSGLKGDPLSPLVLHEPQLAAAKSALESATQAVAAAQENLASTRIEAPFDALVISRAIAPGSYVQAGGEIGQLLSAEVVEISIPLSAADWSALPEESELVSGDYAVELLQMETGQRWSGTAIRTEKNLNSETRQRSLIVAVDNPLQQEPPLYPGTFLQATIPDRAVDGLWQLPASALSQRGEIWTVDENKLLVAHPAKIRFSDQQYIYLEPPENTGAATQVVIQPLSNYSEGMKVQPVQEQLHD